MRAWVRVSVQLRVSIHEPLKVGVHWDGNRSGFRFLLTYILLESIMDRFPSGWEAESSGIAQASPNSGALEPTLKGRIPENPN